ncbi:MAG: hypothetical protein P8Y29_08050 [Gemmatimonadota bacterium]
MTYRLDFCLTPGPTRQRLILARQLDVPLLKRMHLDRLARVQDQLLVLVRLSQVPECALVARLHGEILITLSGDQDHFGERVLGSSLFQDCDAIAPWQAKIGHHEVDRSVLFEPSDSLVPGPGGGYVETVTFEQHRESFEHAWLVVD